MILDQIVEYKTDLVKKQKEKNRSLSDKLAQPGISLLAEIKKASPSKGVICPNFSPLKRLKQYQSGGVAAVSVLTEDKYFQGSKKLLENLSNRAEVPLLRKDFIFDRLQIYESCLLGADVVLLIASIMDQEEITEFIRLARELGLEVLIEVHNQQELEKVLNTPAKIIGINNRDLNDFKVDLTTTEKLVNYLENKNLRHKYHIISESGIKNNQDIKFLRQLDVDGVLVGETLMKTRDPVEKINNLFQE